MSSSTSSGGDRALTRSLEAKPLAFGRRQRAQQWFLGLFTGTTGLVILAGEGATLVGITSVIAGFSLAGLALRRRAVELKDGALHIASFWHRDTIRLDTLVALTAELERDRAAIVAYTRDGDRIVVVESPSLAQARADLPRWRAALRDAQAKLGMSPAPDLEQTFVA